MYNKGDSLALLTVEDDIPGGCVIAKILPQIPKNKTGKDQREIEVKVNSFFLYLM